MGLGGNIFGDAKQTLDKLKSEGTINFARFQKILKDSDIDYCRRAYELLYVMEYIDPVDNQTSYYLDAKINSNEYRDDSAWLIYYLPDKFYDYMTVEQGFEVLLKNSANDDSELLLNRAMKVIYRLAEEKTKYLAECVKNPCDNAYYKSYVEELLHDLCYGNRSITRDDVSASDWQDAMIYLRYKNLRILDLGDDLFERGGKALQNYQILYILETYGEEKVKLLADEYFRKYYYCEDISILGFIGEELGEDFSQKFVKQQEPRSINESDLEKTSFLNFYKYPEWIRFSPDANMKIISKILHDELAGEEVNYYLGTNETLEDCTKIYPAIKHILQTTNSYKLFHVAGSALNTIWGSLLEDNEKLEEWLQGEIYNIFWPRIRSIRRLQNSKELKFINSDEEDIFNNEVDWVLGLNDKTLQRCNPSLWKSLKQEADRGIDGMLEKITQDIPSRAFAVKCSKMSAKEIMNLANIRYGNGVLKHGLYISLCNYVGVTHEGVEEIFNLILSSGDEDNDSICKIKIDDVPKVMYQLVSSNGYCASKQFRTCIMESMIKNFDELVKYICKADFAAIFMAACEGVKQQDEIPLLENLADAIKKQTSYRVEQEDDKGRLDTAWFVIAYTAKHKILEQERRQIASIKNFDLALAKVRQKVVEYEQWVEELQKKLIAYSQKATLQD